MQTHAHGYTHIHTHLQRMTHHLNSLVYSRPALVWSLIWEDVCSSSPASTKVFLLSLIHSFPVLPKQELCSTLISRVHFHSVSHKELLLLQSSLFQSFKGAMCKFCCPFTTLNNDDKTQCYALFSFVLFLYVMHVSCLFFTAHSKNWYFLALLYGSYEHCKKFHWIEWANPTFRGLIYLYIDSCKKIVNTAISNGFCASNSHLSYHSTSSLYT